jgi:hypothetical protein
MNIEFAHDHNKTLDLVGLYDKNKYNCFLVCDVVSKCVHTGQADKFARPTRTII